MTESVLWHLSHDQRMTHLSLFDSPATGVVGTDAGLLARRDDILYVFDGSLQRSQYGGTVMIYQEHQDGISSVKHHSILLLCRQELAP